MEEIQKEFMINGLLVNAVYSKCFLQEIDRLLDAWCELQKKKNRRILVFLAAPPGAGKSTLAAMMEAFAKQKENCKLQVVGMDGFHHYQSYIQTHHVIVDGKQIAMKDVKGCPESFDFDRFYTFLRRLQTEETIGCPIYDRKLHDVVDNQMEIHAPIVLVEGNYLLLDEKPWCAVSTLCDDSIFIKADIDMLKLRLLQRKMMGGSLAHEAVRFYEQSDQRNIERVLRHSIQAAHTIELFEGAYQWK